MADYILDPSEVDVVEEVKKLTNGEGVDVAFECTSVKAQLGRVVADAFDGFACDFDVVYLGSSSNFGMAI